MQVAADIPLTGFNAAIDEAAEFSSTLNPDSNPEMLAEAWAGLEAEVHNAAVRDKQEAELALRLATDNDIAKLEEIITIALDQNHWGAFPPDEADQMARPEPSRRAGQLRNLAARILRRR